MPQWAPPTPPLREQPRVSVSTMAVQQAMEAWRVRQAPPEADAPDPGPLDGLWGPRTAEALQAFVDYSAAHRGQAYANITVVADRRDRHVDVPEVLAFDIASLQRDYQQIIAGHLESRIGPVRRPQATPQQVGPATDGEEAPAEGGGLVLGPPVPQQRGLSTFAKFSLGFLLLGGLTGLGYWWWRRRR